jgi:hypothetical protein
VLPVQWAAATRRLDLATRALPGSGAGFSGVLAALEQFLAVRRAAAQAEGPGSDVARAQRASCRVDR